MGKRGNKTHGMYKTRLYSIWMDMRSRCGKFYAKHYEYYGGRGISVCNEWNKSFESFRDWAYTNGYDDSLTIERIDVNGNYCPENCKWITPYEQHLNTRRSVYIQIGDERLTLKEWADRIGVNYATLCNRRRLGWNDIDIITKPIARCGRGVK